MLILHAIREARSEDQVFELLTAYRDAVRFDDELHDSSLPAVGTPITDIDTVGRQIEALVGLLQAASRRLDDRSRLLIKEALHVFCAALDRLELLTEGPRQPGVAHRSGEVLHLLASS